MDFVALSRKLAALYPKWCIARWVIILHSVDNCLKVEFVLLISNRCNFPFQNKCVNSSNKVSAPVRDSFSVHLLGCSNSPILGCQKTTYRGSNTDRWSTGKSVSFPSIHVQIVHTFPRFHSLAYWEVIWNHNRERIGQPYSLAVGQERWKNRLEINFPTSVCKFYNKDCI